MYISVTHRGLCVVGAFSERVALLLELCQPPLPLPHLAYRRLQYAYCTRVRMSANCELGVASVSRESHSSSSSASRRSHSRT